jgi:hypothetical protein
LRLRFGLGFWLRLRLGFRFRLRLRFGFRLWLGFGFRLFGVGLRRRRGRCWRRGLNDYGGSGSRRLGVWLARIVSITTLMRSRLRTVLSGVDGNVGSLYNGVPDNLFPAAVVGSRSGHGRAGNGKERKILEGNHGDCWYIGVVQGFAYDGSKEGLFDGGGDVLFL